VSVIRAATPEDLPLVRELWHAFDEEIPDAPWRDSDSAEDLDEFERAFADHVVLLADDVGLAIARKKGSRIGYLGLLYVRPEARKSGLAAELVREAATRLRERGADMLELSVLASNEEARAVYERWGFSPVELTLAAPIDRIVERIAARPDGPTFGSIHVQTDDTGAVERSALKTLPRLGRTAGTSVSGPRDGWVAVHDELCDRDPKQLQRLAKEISYTLAAVVLSIGVERGAVVRYTLYDRGSEVDEYLSVPEFYGPLPPGDVIALGANPTVVARLTGADAGRVRAVARTAAAPADLPPPVELIRAIAETMGIAEADHGWVASEG
jgi:ribosomal protein S18 acetylase RimI-like enzyme